MRFFELSDLKIKFETKHKMLALIYEVWTNIIAIIWLALERARSFYFNIVVHTYVLQEALKKVCLDRFFGVLCRL